MSDNTSQHPRLTPLQICTRVVGSIAAVADALGLERTAVSHWQHGTHSRRAGDLPSTTYTRAMLAHCAARDLPMRADWLIWGATAAEVDAALAEHRARAA